MNYIYMYILKLNEMNILENLMKGVLSFPNVYSIISILLLISSTLESTGGCIVRGGCMCIEWGSFDPHSLSKFY